MPYRYGSRTDGAGETAPATVASLRAKLAEMFPAAAGAAVEHAWSGVLGVPRDWCISAAADPRTGIARAGGYVGEGVAAANLAGRTLRDLMLAEDSELAELAWVARRQRPLGARAAALEHDPGCLRALPARRCRASAAAGVPRAWRGSSTLHPDARERIASRRPLRGRRRGRRRRPGALARRYRGATMSFQTLHYDTDEAIATITLNRPERLNTIVPPMPEELEAAMQRATPTSR